MHISREEALSLLEKWRAGGTTLRVHLGGKDGEFEGTVRAVSGNAVTLTRGGEPVDVDLRDGDFNGDHRDGSGSRGAYLVCELPSGARYSFRA